MKLHINRGIDRYKYITIEYEDEKVKVSVQLIFLNVCKYY